MLDFIIKILNLLFIVHWKLFLTSILLFLFSILTFKNYNIKIPSRIFFAIIPFIVIFLYFSSLPKYISFLSQDSINEIFADFGEVIFFIYSFIKYLFDFDILKKKVLWLILLSSFSTSIFLYYFLRYYFKKNNLDFRLTRKVLRNVYFILLAGVIISFYQLYNFNSKSIQKLDASKDIHYKNIDRFVFKKNESLYKNLDVVIYLGESTSRLSMNLYGYPFKNTNWLSSLKKDEKFLLFNNMHSNHSHSVPSLNNAFTICVKNNENDCILTSSTLFGESKLNSDNFLSIFDILKNVNVETSFITNQNRERKSDLASFQIFKTKKENLITRDKKQRIHNLLFSNETSFSKDLNFFEKNYCNNKNVIKKSVSSLNVLHSYAGHGSLSGYRFHIDYSPFDYPEYVSDINFLGRDKRFYELTKQYDSAISYIDKTLEKTMKCSFEKSKKLGKPQIFIYFADHGESPFAGLGHDSSRVTYEMMTVPFFIYFNKEAFETFYEEFKFLEQLKNKNLSLKTASEIILYLFKIDIKTKNLENVRKFDNFNSLKINSLLEKFDKEKKLKMLPTNWNSQTLKKFEMLNNNFYENDITIKLWQINNYLQNLKKNEKYSEKFVCMHRANTLILQYKASFTTGCFETDIFHFKEKSISTHKIEHDSNLIFKNFLESNYQDTTVWMDSKNLDKEKNCRYGLKWLLKYSKKLDRILVEIPTTSINQIDNNLWKECIQKINSIQNIEVAYYLKNSLLRKCTVGNDPQCKDLDKNIKKFLDKTKIKSITFDYGDGYLYAINSKILSEYKWHMWNLQNLEDIEEVLQNKNTGIILLKNNKNITNFL